MPEKGQELGGAKRRQQEVAECMEESEGRLARMQEEQRKCAEPHWLLAQAKAALDRGRAAVLIVAPEAADPLGADEAQRVQELLGSLKELLE